MRVLCLLLLISLLLLTGCQSRNPNLSLKQKVGQLLFIGLAQNDIVANQGILSELQPGGLILFARNFTTADDTIEAVNAYRQNADIPWPLFVGTDQEGGEVSRLPEQWATQYPEARLVGENPDLAGQLAEAMGRELGALGLNMNFAPVLDINSNPLNPVIGSRAYGTTPEDVWLVAQSVINGLMAQGIIPVVKHFPGHGDTSIDSHLEMPSVPVGLDVLENRELWPFREAVNAGVPTLMVGHLLVPALDPDHPASLSSTIITDLLRNEWGYQGLVVTDDMEMGAICQDDIGEAAVVAVQAGADMLLVCHSLDKQLAVRDALVDAVEQGRISEERLNDSLARIRKLKDEFGLNRAAIDSAQALGILGSKDHKNLVDSLRGKRE